MKRKPPDSRNALSALRLSLALSLVTVIPLLLYGSAPSWWSQRGILVSGANADDYAPANQGQLKNIAKAAVAEMDAKLSGGAGQQLHDLVNGWSTPTAQTNDFAPLNIGQLKNVAKLFYDRLIAAGLVAQYPWTNIPNPPDDFAVANIGQVKKLFSFDLTSNVDSDGDGMSDAWELEHFGTIDANPNADPDGDGLTNLQEFLSGTDPNDYFNGTTPIIEIVSGNNQFGDAGTFVPQPLTVRVRTSGESLVNAPVNFTVLPGTGGLSLTSGGAQANALLRRTDLAGNVRVYYALPPTSGISTRVTASTVGTSGPSVSFREVAKLQPPPTPTPDPSASPTPTPTAMPAPPYRYAIIDLGKDVYPIRVNNKGTVLCYSFDSNGNGGPARWKGGVLERLTYLGANPSLISAYDMNDQDVVVGQIGFEGPWNDTEVHEFAAGLRWPANSATAEKISALSAVPGLPPTAEGLTFKYALLSAIRNSGETFGQMSTGSVRGLLYGSYLVMNSMQLTAGSTSPVQISNASATNEPIPSLRSHWTGSIDYIGRASNGHYVGTKLIPFPDNLVVDGTPYGDLSGMIDGQVVDFYPTDLNEGGVVIGTNSVYELMRIRTLPVPPLQALPDTVLPGVGPIAINDHVRLPQSQPSPTPVAAPQILSRDGNVLVLRERLEDNTWYPFALEEMIPSMDGWLYIDPYDMNDAGAIVGRGWYTDPSNPQAPGETHAFLLVPAELMVDANRDGEMSFDDPLIHDGDQTSEEKPYRFWINDDDDGSAGDLDDHVPPRAPDYADGTIRSIRDLEDFARLHVNLAGLEVGLESGSIKAAFEWKQTSNSPKIKIYRAASGGTDYLTNESKAVSSTLFPFRDTLGEVAPGIPLFMPQDFWVSASQFSNVPKTLPVGWFLFEGSGEGKGQLILSFWKDGRKIGETAGVWLELRDVKQMYQRATATPESLTEPYASSGHVFNDDSVGYAPDVTPRFESPPDEDEHCLIFVHGWKATEDDATNASQTMFKRLWWEGYKGRFATFRWPTKTSAISYNTSEWLAWKYGKSLADYATNYVRRQLPSYRVSIAAHSMGNIVTGAALKRGLTLDRYLLMEAAVPAGCYEDSVNSYQRFLAAEANHQTPDGVSEMGYRLFLASTRANVVKFVSFFNVDDFALATGVTRILGWPFDTNWEKNQVDYKPDNFGSGTYLYLGNGASYFRAVEDETFRRITDMHESMAFVARPRSRAAGAELHNATVFGSVLNLQTSCDFGPEVGDHSGQFTRPIQQLKPFYQRMVSELKQ